MKDLKLVRFCVRNAFIGSIQVSLDPNDAMFDSVCRDFAIRVNVRRARGLMSSTSPLVNVFEMITVETYLSRVRTAED